MFYALDSLLLFWLALFVAAIATVTGLLPAGFALQPVRIFATQRVDPRPRDAARGILFTRPPPASF